MRLLYFIVLIAICGSQTKPVFADNTEVPSPKNASTANIVPQDPSERRALLGEGPAGQALFNFEAIPIGHLVIGYPQAVALSLGVIAGPFCGNDCFGLYAGYEPGLFGRKFIAGLGLRKGNASRCVAGYSHFDLYADSGEQDPARPYVTGIEMSCYRLVSWHFGAYTFNSEDKHGKDHFFSFGLGFGFD